MLAALISDEQKPYQLPVSETNGKELTREDNKKVLYCDFKSSPIKEDIEEREKFGQNLLDLIQQAEDLLIKIDRYLRRVHFLTLRY